MSKILLFGWNGWIGGQVSNLLKESNYTIVNAKSRLDNYKELIDEIENTDCHCVVNCAGLTGRPNVDWCESHKTEVLETNVIGTSLLADLCHRKNIYYVYMGTGCIFEYDSKHLNPDFVVGVTGFTEEDAPNFDKSFYSYGKILVEKITKCFPNSLILRIRMPISDDLHPRSFITKITKYQKVVNVSNSMSVLHDLLPLVPKMIADHKTGIYNFTNPGYINHNTILGLYKEYIDPEFTWQNFTLEEQAKILAAPRSNNFLDASKLAKEYAVPDIQTSMIEVFKRMKEIEGKN